MNRAHWVDHGVVPPRLLPETVDAALAYLTHALRHVCYERWTLTRLKHAYAVLSDAKAARPSTFRLLLDHSEVIEWWERGRVCTAPIIDALPPEIVLDRLLHAHRRRFKQADTNVLAAWPQADGTHAWLAAVETERTGALAAWLGHAGRFVNRHAATNTLAATDDAQAVTLFLRDRAGRSRHTLRAYAADIRKLIGWCCDQQLGPLSDLTRNDLLVYRDALSTARATTAQQGRHRAEAPGERAQARALAVVASLYQYWFDTGYLSANPASGLVTGTQARTGFAPRRFLPAAALAACDTWLESTAGNANDAVNARRRAVWVLYRYGGVRLAELAWSIDTGLPRVEVEDGGQWTLYVRGKGNKPRAIPLPAVAVAPLIAYRVTRGLPVKPAAHELLPLIHGFKGGSLQEAGLYAEVKAIFDAVADSIQAGYPARAVLLRAASPHWLRHAYAKALVVDHQAPLPVAQALLGHASVQTTATYAKTDLSQLRTFVEGSFGNNRK
jgi:site-specific recombinase XerD